MTTLSDTAAKRQLSQLQKAIIDGLEDIKGQNIAAFDTTHLSPLFERVIVASAASSRQTKALAASVRDKLREAGFDKPRTEGEENGEWIIVDCGAAVVHIMQPGIRDYYRIEEIWGEKPVKASAATKKAASRAADAAAKQPKKPAAAKATGTEAPAGKATRTQPKTAVKKTAAKTSTRTATKTAVKTATKTATKTAAKTVGKPAARKTAVKKSTTKPAAAAAAAAKQPKAAKTATKSTARKTRTTPSAD